MTLGIDASRAFLKKRTGIEEYSYQVIKHLRDVLPDGEKVILYVRQELGSSEAQIDFELPENWEVTTVRAPRFCTQIHMAWRLAKDGVDTLFVPLHTLLILHPLYSIIRFLRKKKKLRTVVVVHGLEYEFFPEAYSWWERIYMRAAIRFSSRVASRVVTVSENTKKDLIRLYRIPEEKITVIYEGKGEYPLSNLEPYISQSPYFLFVGRVEERKNIVRMIEAYESFKQKTGLSHKLILAGKPGYGYEKIQYQKSKSKYQDEIFETGYISEEKKWQLLKGAEALLFPSLYEGFGLPILEAQQVGTPVITSTTSSLPEIAGEGALLIDPLDLQALADAMEKLATDPELRAGIIDKATQNVDRFRWARCAGEVAVTLIS